MKLTGALLIGVVIGLGLAAALAGWMWAHLTEGNDRPLSPEEIRDRVGETW